MIKNLVKHGNSWALVIDRPILDLLNIDPAGEVEITTDGRSMTIAPIAKDSRKAVVHAARKKVNTRYGKAFKKLAEQPRMVTFLSLDEVLESHAEQIATYGGSDGIRDLGLLESALSQPAAMFGGQYLHADIYEMAAAYLFHVVKNHPFVDGNKRVSLEAALLFLATNGHSVETTDDELVELVLQTVAGRLSKPQIAEFFRSCARRALTDDDG